MISTIAGSKPIPGKLTEPQLLLLTAIRDYIFLHREWPTYGRLSRILVNRTSVSLDEIVRSLPAGLSNPSEVTSRDKVAIITVPALYYCGGADALTRAFLRMLKLCVALYFDGDNLDEPEISTAQLADLFSVEPHLTDLVALLLKIEPNIIGSGSMYNDSTWCYKIADDIRRYRYVQTIEDYIEARPIPSLYEPSRLLAVEGSVSLSEEPPEFAAIAHLHPQTLALIAELVCGEHTTPYQTAVKIEQFLKRADGRFNAFDGVTPRKQWVLAQLIACMEIRDQEFGSSGVDRASLVAVIICLADPRSYPGNRNLHHEVLSLLNGALAPEGLMITVARAKPQLQLVTNHIPAVETSTARYLCPDFRAFTPDVALVSLLEERWAEAQRCMAANAHLATVILLGSILEGTLSVIVKLRPAEANRSTKSPKDSAGKPKSFREWSLHDLIEVASDSGWIKADRLRFSHALRESRNLIHPQLQQATDEWPNESSCRICWEVVHAALDDLRVASVSN